MVTTTSVRETVKSLDNLVPSFEPQLSLPGDSNGCSQTILLVEDECLVRDITAEMLQINGYTVLTAESADEAIRIFQRHRGPIHLLLTDVVMPGMNGRDLSSRLSACYSDLRTVFISGYTENAVVRDGFRDPGAAYLQKPFTLAALLTKVREAISSDTSSCAPGPLQ